MHHSFGFLQVTPEDSNTIAATYLIFTDIAGAHRDGAEAQEETEEMKDEKGAIEGEGEGEYVEGDDM